LPLFSSEALEFAPLRYAIARFLQLLGLATVLLGFYVGVTVSNVKAELIYLGVGAAIFYGGRLLQGKDES
jgi:hypothetical protein